MTELPVPVPAPTRHELVAVEPMSPTGRAIWEYRGVRIVEHRHIPNEQARQAVFTLEGHPHSGKAYSFVETARAAIDAWLDAGALLRGYTWPKDWPRPEQQRGPEA